MVKGRLRGTAFAARNEQMAAAYAAGLNMIEVAAQFDLDAKYVCRCLRAAGNVGRQGVNAMKPATASEMSIKGSSSAWGKQAGASDRFVKPFRDGKTIAEIATMFAVTNANVYTGLKRHGVIEKTSRKDKGKRDAIIQSRKSGETVREIAASLGISQQRVRQILKDTA